MADHLELLKKLQANLDSLETTGLPAESIELIEGMKEDLDDVIKAEEVPGFMTHRLQFLAMEFEASHPRLTEFINHVSSALSNAGI